MNTMVLRLQKDIARARRQANAAKDEIVELVFLELAYKKQQRLLFLKRLMRVA